MGVVFITFITSTAFITFITLRLLSSRVRFIRIQSPENLRYLRKQRHYNTTTTLFCGCDGDTCNVNSVVMVDGCFSFFFFFFSYGHRLHNQELLLLFIFFLQFANLLHTVPQRQGTN